MKTIWHPHADADLENLISYTAKEFPLTAARWLEMIRNQANLLSTHPKLYSGKAGNVEGTREMIIDGAPFWLVFAYKNNNKAVGILRVFRDGKDKPIHISENDDNNWMVN